MTEWILSISPSLKLVLVLAAVVGLMRAGLSMGWALLAGALALWAGFPHAPLHLARSFAGVGTDGPSNLEQSLFLLLIVVGILVFSSALNETGQIRRIIDAFQRIVGPSRIALVAFPALIGLLPMPGGAIFSAPMVGAAVAETDLTPARKAIANYWFRHIWEYWLPLYPGVIMALTLTGVSPGAFIAVLLPMTFVSLAVGYSVILHGIRITGRRTRDLSSGAFAAFARELTPIFIVVGAVALLSPVVDGVLESAGVESMLLKRSPILLGVAAALLWLTLRGFDASMLGAVLRKKNIRQMAFLVLGLMAFKAVLDSSGAVAMLDDEFKRYHVPFVLVVALLPFVAGLVTGIAVAFVGASFPLVIALVSTVPESERLAYYFLAYATGYVGMMISPVHICLIATAEYFEARLGRVYAYLLPLSAAVLLAAVPLFLLYRHMLAP